ncbi:hypothetical protein Pcac1_g5617 [Phytophthora cactorum]|uniref:Uncharacterized protein n=1 Tax=Phytophthora cactorum TaxID=29920 RepID=A0A329SBL9_9STRA|nr:hypothetical protein Pcac1_g5617 [Phytophthora cactorum]RAW34060.1 hypothetical protein PC110_g9610 [Phytophthora cactorum]
MALGARSTAAASHPAASTSHIKRKRENEASTQRHVAQKLHQCADVNDSFSRLERSLKLQWQRYKTQKSRADELSRIRVAVAQMTHFQTLFGAEMDGENVEISQVTSLGKRTDKLLVKLSNRKKPVARRTQKVVKRLPHLMKRATSIVAERRRLIKEQQELPARHQWVPMILWKLYDSVADATGKEEEKKPLKTAMHKVMKTLKETNPFFYLQVLYQPPPEHLDERWEITASERLTAITASMAPHFIALSKRSAALRNKRDAFVRIRYGWNQLRVTLSFARRAARHFHFLVLHLYSVAMRCDAPNVNAAIISEKAMSGILSDDVELRAQLRLNRDSATSEDHLLKESYEWTPELLVYLDEWRWCRDSGRVLFGFDRREQYQDFLPQFSFEDQSRRQSRRIPRFDVLAEIGYELRGVDRAWRASRLGTSGFESMRIEDIGALERKIKDSLGVVVDLVYKMMLARWMDRRKRSTEWWTSLELCEGQEVDSDPDVVELPDEFIADYAEDSQDEIPQTTASKIVERNEDVQDATDAESVEPKEIRRMRTHVPVQSGFRRPTIVNLRGVAQVSKAKSLGQVFKKTLADEQSMRLNNIYEWSDVDKTERIAKVQAAMVGLCDRLKWSKSSLESARPEVGEFIRDDWRVTCLASHVCKLTDQAVAFTEQVEMYDAATVKKPRLRLNEEDSASVQKSNDRIASHLESEDPITKELLESLQSAKRNVAEVLSPYDGQHSTEWRDAILSTGLATVELLRMIAQDEAAHEVLVGCENGGD